jgi:hypothetical protein
VQKTLLHLSLFFSLVLSGNHAFSQGSLTDTFEDGNFSSSPGWIGHTDSFNVFNDGANNWLRLNASGTNTTSYLSTASTAASGIWEMRFRMDFALSTSNFARFYFISSSSVLTGSLNGYYIAFSQVSGEIGLYRQTGTTTTRLAGTAVAALGTAPVNIRLRVTRSEAGLFAVLADVTGGNTFVSLFTFTDTSFSSSAFSGITVRYTSTRNKTFYFDDFAWPVTPLRLLSANAAGKSEIELLFSKPPAPSTVLPEAFSISGAGNPVSATSTGATVLLTYAAPLTGGAKTVSVSSSLTDTDGNALQDGYRSVAFAITDTPAPGELIINEVLFDPPSGMQDYVELRNTTGDKYFELRDLRLGDNTSSAQISSGFLLSPGSFAVISSDTTALQNQFGSKPYISLSGLPNFNATGSDAVVLRSSSQVRIDSLTYQVSWGTAKKALERKSATVLSTLRANWGASPASIGTPGEANQIEADVIKPALRSAELQFQDRLLLVFSEEVTAVSAQTLSNFRFTGGISASSAVRFAPDSVLVTLENVSENVPFRLTVQGVSDVFGNTMDAVSRDLRWVTLSTPVPGQLAIQEVLFDPPTGQQDYVELKNTTASSYFSLRNMRLADNSGSALLTANLILEPGELIVISSDTTALRNQFGAIRMALLSGMPNFNATGTDAVILRSASGTTLDSLTYATSWGTAKKSIERRSTTVPATARVNWGASPAAIGTPGTANLIAADITAPRLRSASLVSQNQLLLVFSEEVTAISAQTLSNFQFTGGVSAWSALRLAADSVVVTISGVTEAVPFTLSIRNVSDLFGNMIAETQTTLEWLTLSEAAAGDLIINELMFDPPAGLQDYIELINRSAKNLDLTTILFADAGQTFRPVSSTPRALKPGAYVVVLRDSTLLTTFPGIPLSVTGSAFPSLNNTGQESVILKSGSVTLDSVTWNPSTWGGAKVALERRSPTVSGAARINWLASVHPLKGTPGNQNTAQPDTVRPNITGIALVNAQTIDITVNKELSTSSYTNASGSISGGLAVNFIVPADPQVMRINLLQPMQNRQEYTLTVSGVTDLFGNALVSVPQTFTYFTVGTPLPGNVLVTEFMYDPPSGFTEFIELRNVSENALNLQGWTFNDRGGSPRVITALPYMLPPDTFVVLAPDSSVARLFPGIRILTMGSNFASLNNSDDNIVIRTAGKLLIDSLSYSASWGGAQTSLERRSITAGSNLRDNWTSSIAATFATPGFSNSVTIPAGAPAIVQAFARSPDTLWFEFNRALRFGESFSVATTPQRGIAGFSISGNFLALRLTKALVDQESVRVGLSGLEDVFGNAAGTITREIHYFEYKEPASGDIRITEFLYDPPSGTGEFVEIQNVTNSVLNLQNWLLNNSRLSRPVLSATKALMPGARFVFVADSSILKLFPEADGAVVASFPALNNSGDAVVIKSAGRVTLDSVSYLAGWGGTRVSLERRSITIDSRQQDNWGSSVSASRMTPGSANSIGVITTKPAVVGVFIQGADSIFVDFDRSITAGTAFQASIRRSENTELLQPLFTGRRLKFGMQRRFEDRETATLTLQQVQDIFGNVLSGFQTGLVYYDFQPAGVASLRITEFAYDPPPGIAEFVELENISNDVLDLNTLRISNKSPVFRTVSSIKRAFLPGQRVVLTVDSALHRAFPDRNVVVVAGFPSLTNTSDAIIIKNLTGVTLDSLTYSSTWGGREQSLERRSNSVSAGIRSNWGVSPSTEKHTLGLANLLAPDDVKPIVVAADLVYPDTLKIRFSEEIRPLAGSLQLTFQGQTASGFRYAGTDVFAGFGSIVSGNGSIAFALRGATDWFSNTMRDTTIGVIRPAFSDAVAGDVVINEILFRSSTRFPEFVELWNTSSKTIDLSGWTISNESATGRMRPLLGKSANGLSVPLLPDSMVVLTGNAELAAAVQNALLISGMPSLGNAGDQIVLRTSALKTIDSLVYRDSWGAPVAGQSLERRDPLRFSIDPSNWTTGPSGGTAGRMNNAFQPDLTPPHVLIARHIESDTIEVRFSEFVQVEQDAFAINGIAAALYDAPGVSRKIWRIRNTGSFEGQPASVSVIRVEDARGNTSRNLSIPVAWKVIPGRLAINEILHDPIAITNDGRPDQSEWVELKNTTTGALSLEGIRLQTPRDELGRFRILDVDSTAARYLNPGEVFVIHADTAKHFLDSRIAVYYGNSDRTKFFRSPRTSLSLGASSGFVVLADSNGVIIDSVAYASAWHNPNRRDIRGRSLERIDPMRNPNAGFNWSTSTSETGATPGQANTLYRESQAPSILNGIEISPNPFSPDADGFEDQTIISWAFERTDFMLRIRVFDRYGRVMAIIADHYAAGLQGSVTWDGNADDRKTVRPGLYIVVVEAYDTNGGSRRTFKKTVAVAAGRG